MRLGRPLLAVFAVTFAFAVSGTPVLAVDEVVGDIGALKSALGDCAGTLGAPDTFTLTGDIEAPADTVFVTDACVAVLDLDGSDLAVENIVLGVGAQLTIRDSGGGVTGTLTADASGAAGLAASGRPMRR